MPDKLCKDCTEKAYLAYNFKITIEQNDSTLRSVLFKDSSMKKDEAVFDETNTYLGLGIKTEIAFVDADPFIDDDGDFDYINATTDNSNPATDHQQQQQQQQTLDNNNCYQQEDEEIVQVEGNNEQEVEDEEEACEQDDEEENEEEEIEESFDENFELSMSKENKLKKKSSQVAVRYQGGGEIGDFVKDDDGKFICQICNKKLVDKKGLNLHLRLHTGKDLKRCNVCNRGNINLIFN